MICMNRMQAAKSKVGKKAAEATDKVKDQIEDVREAWETSQNPLVYRISELWDAMSYETDDAIATKELQRLDPTFSLEKFKHTMCETICPRLIHDWIAGDESALEGYFSSDMYRLLCQDIKSRKEEKRFIDPHVLAVDMAELFVPPQDFSKRSPMIAGYVRVQQIYCTRNEIGEILEVRPLFPDVPLPTALPHPATKDWSRPVSSPPSVISRPSRRQPSRGLKPYQFKAE